jgi:chaperonin cofactor prefoldin
MLRLWWCMSSPSRPLAVTPENLGRILDRVERLAHENQVLTRQVELLMQQVEDAHHCIRELSNLIREIWDNLEGRWERLEKGLEHIDSQQDGLQGRCDHLITLMRRPFWQQLQDASAPEWLVKQAFEEYVRRLNRTLAQEPESPPEGEQT